MNTLKKAIRLSVLIMTPVFLLTGWAMGEVKLVKGQTIHIVSYPNIVSESYRINMRGNLIIHNTDQHHPITLVRIDHYNTDGKLVEKYLKSPLKLGPLAASRVIVKQPHHHEEKPGITFIVQWQADQPVTAPLVKCFIVGALSGQGYSFTSSGNVIHEEK
jgi:hypothetical protein